MLISCSHKCKGWSFSGSNPPPDVGEEDHTVGIGGTKWYTMLDLLEVPLPTLHFSKKARGRLMIGTEVFKGSMVEDMEKFVPKPLTRPPWKVHTYHSRDEV